MAEEKAKAQLVGDRIVVWDAEEGSALYARGYYGKPVGIAKPKTSDFEVPLNIDLIEGLYLVEKETIRVTRGLKGRGLGARALREYARKVYEGFEPRYIVYKNLREKGYIVLSGVKFGCEFAVYERGPGIDHAPYLISVRETGEALTSVDIVRAGRLATTVRKRFIIAIPDLRDESVKYVIFQWFKA